MQGMQLKRILPFTVLAGCLAWSSHVGGLKFIPIYEALTIKAQKNSPPHIAFEELLESDRKNLEWAKLEKIKPQTLAVSKQAPVPLFAKKVEIPEMVFKKTSERVVAEASPSQEAASDDWMSELPRTQAMRLQEAQRRSEVLSENWSGPTWSETAKEVLEKSGALVETGSSSRVYVAATDASGKSQTGRSRPTVEFPQGDGSRGPSSQTSQQDDFQPSNSFMEKARTQAIVGPIEITGGLAVTNEHHIEIRRSDEGVLKELGRVDLIQGLYNIEVEEPSGSIIARLVDKEGKILGEGSFRLSRVLVTSNKPAQGPKIRIEPHASIAGIVSNFYNSRVNDVAPAQTRVTFMKGASESLVKKDGVVAMNNVAKGSTTVLRAAAPKFYQTTAVVVSGDEFKASLYPEAMINALQEIVSQQRSLSLEGAPAIVWGRVSLDGKNLSGIDVVIESDPDLQPIYFNSFMLPDPNLKSTSDNGLFAFVNVSSGYHSLLATRANAILGYQNVVVEEGSVAQGDILSTMKLETIPLRAFDAFTGEPQNAVATMQSLSEEVEIQNGVKTVTLPHVNRQGLLRIQPENTDYIGARYTYNDTDEFIHIPMIRWSWLSAIKSYLRIDDAPSAGFVVGFVPDEDFEVYLAGVDDFNPRHIVYFDMQGRILQNRKGIAGGGFILYNVPEDTHEIVVVGARTQKIYSRVIPVDANSVSVLSFRE